MEKERRGDMKHTVYVKLNQITEVSHRDVCLKDVAQVYCREKTVQNKCSVMKILTVEAGKARRYVISALDVVEGLEALDPSIEVSNTGEVDFIVAYKPPFPSCRAWQWLKTLFVCAACFFGAAFAIMTFNNDVSITDVFGEIYKLVMGQEPQGLSLLEAGYSIGLSIGIVVFFNHVAAVKLNTDPTPLEVEMRLYEENICKTLIANEGRKESGIDIR